MWRGKIEGGRQFGDYFDVPHEKSQEPEVRSQWQNKEEEMSVIAVRKAE